MRHRGERRRGKQQQSADAVDALLGHPCRRRCAEVRCCARLRWHACCLPLRARRRRRVRALWRLTCARTLLGRHYDARARGVLRRVARELRVPWQVCQAAVLPRGLITLLPARSCGPRASSLRRVGLGSDASGRGLEHQRARPRPGCACRIVHVRICSRQLSLTPWARLALLCALHV